MSPDRGEGGKFAPKVDEEDVLRVLRAHGEPVATAADLTHALDAEVTSETVRRRLNSLHDAGRVGRKQVGARAVVWWVRGGGGTDAPAAPLQKLVGMLSEEEAARARERSEEWREEFGRGMSDGGA